MNNDANIVRFEELTKDDAISWLRTNDPEGMPFWQDSMTIEDAKGCVLDNLADFGKQPQSGLIIVEVNLN
nr:conserved hypothetical protein [Vibrio chagasii]